MTLHKAPELVKTLVLLIVMDRSISQQTDIVTYKAAMAAEKAHLCIIASLLSKKPLRQRITSASNDVFHYKTNW